MNGQPYAGPKPVVFNMSALPAGNVARNFVPGVDYWPFDLAEAGINSIAHLYVAPDGVILGTEQNTVQQPFRQCSIGGILVENGPNQCLNAGGKIILYNRIFGFERAGNAYRNVRRNTDPALPLCKHFHPTELPNSDRYYDPQTVGDNFQYKYAEFCGSSKTLLATVMAHDRQSKEIPFSRLMLIDIADPDNPVYFDLTGWLEDEFSARWAPGTASGFTGTAFAGNFSVTWDGRDDFGQAVSSGTYFYRLRAGAFEQVRAMTLLR
jgi:hypothetical protein